MVQPREQNLQSNRRRIAPTPARTPSRSPPKRAAKSPKRAAKFPAKQTPAVQVASKNRPEQVANTCDVAGQRREAELSLELSRLFLSLVLVYFATLYSGASPQARSIVKAGAIGALIFLALAAKDLPTSRKVVYVPTIALGLGFCAVGDVLLELNEGTRSQDGVFFLFGLAAFLVGHVLYTVAFASDAVAPSPLVAGPVAAYIGYVFFAVLRPVLPAHLVLPVAAYHFAIGAMTITALSRSTLSARSFAYGAGGAVLFTISDTILAIDLFVQKLPFAKYAVMVTYFLAQLGVALSTGSAPSAS